MTREIRKYKSIHTVCKYLHNGNILETTFSISEQPKKSTNTRQRYTCINPLNIIHYNKPRINQFFIMKLINMRNDLENMKWHTYR